MSASLDPPLLPEEAENPPDLAFPVTVFDIAFHPTSDVLAAGLISGKLELFSYAPGESKRILGLQLHKDGLRSLAFTADGLHLFTGSSDHSVKCINTSGELVWSAEEGHASAVNVVKTFSENLLATGDDDGGIKLWDTRTPGAAAIVFTKHSDVIQDLLVDEERATLLSASGDGTIGVVDLRKGKFVARTEEDEDEYLSLTTVKGGSTVIAGTQAGALEIWQWGKWKPKAGEPYGPDRFTGHPDSVDAILTVDDDTIITGSSDGLIRLLTIQPNKLVGIIGEHGEFPIESLAWSRDQRYLGSVSHDNVVKFWDVAYLFEDDGTGTTGASKFLAMPELHMAADESDEDDDDDDDDGAMHARSQRRAAAGAGMRDSDEEDDEDDEEDEDEDDEDEDDEVEEDVPMSSGKSGKPQGGAKPGTKSFYDDL